MRIPVWLTYAIAALVIAFGAYRLYLAFAKADAERPQRGMYALGKRTHALIGTVYLLLGGALIATALGWNPFGDFFGPDTEKPTKDAAPTKSTVPIDQPKP